MAPPYDDTTNDEEDVQQAHPEEDEEQEEQAEDEEEEENKPDLPFGTKAGIFGGTFVTSALIDVIAAHGNPTGLVIGGILAYVCAKHSPDFFYGAAREWFPLPAPSSPPERKGGRGKRTLYERMMGIYPAEPQEEEEEGHPVQEKEERKKQMQAKKQHSPQQDTPEQQSSIDNHQEGREYYQPFKHQDCLFLSHTFYPHADQVLSGRVSIFGISGSGKSNTLAVFCEEFGRKGVPMLLFDTEDEYQSLCSKQFLLHPYQADARTVTVEHARTFARFVLEERMQVVLNLQSYPTDDEAAMVMIELIRGLRQWEEERAWEERLPCMVVLDEASVWLPQNERESLLSREPDEEQGGMSLLAQLQQTFFSVVVRRGRKRGIGFVFATQRIAEIDKRAMSCNWMILHRQSLPNDLQRYSQLGIERDVAQALATGEAYILGPDGLREVHHIRQRLSPDQAGSPGLAHLKRANSSSSAPTPFSPTQQPPSLRLVTPSPEMMEASGLPWHTQETMEYRMPDLPQRQPDGGAPRIAKLPSELQRALDAYTAGARTYRELGEALGIGKDKAGELIEGLEKRKLIPERSARKRKENVADE